MRLAIIWVFALGCGGGKGGGVPVSPDTLVVELSATQQQLLCEDFVASICSMPDFQSFCSPCVTTEGCSLAASSSAISDRCDVGPITAGMVSQCGDTGDFEVCSMGGGCMIDALEAVCRDEPPPPPPFDGGSPLPDAAVPPDSAL